MKKFRIILFYIIFVCKFSISGQVLFPGINLKKIHTKNTEREFYIYAPPSYQVGKQLPVLFVFHPNNYSAKEMYSISSLLELSNKNQMLLIFPQGGLGNENNGYVWDLNDSLYASSNDYETACFSKILDFLTDSLLLTDDNIFLTGFFEGGVLANKIACEYSKTINATISVSANLTVLDCNPKSSVSALIIRGIVSTDDSVNVTMNFEPILTDKLAVFWNKHNKCNQGPYLQLYPNAYCKSYINTQSWARVTDFMFYKKLNSWNDVKSELSSYNRNRNSNTQITLLQVIQSFIELHLEK